MLIYVFPPHYQLVYISFDISSFSVISYCAICIKLYDNLHQITTHSASNYKQRSAKKNYHTAFIIISPINTTLQKDK